MTELGRQRLSRKGQRVEGLVRDGRADAVEPGAALLRPRRGEGRAA
jgi:hypothetical protein